MQRLPVILFLCMTLSCVTTAIPETELATTAAEQSRAGCGATFSLTQGDLTGSGLYAIGTYPEPGRGQVLQHFPSVAEIQAFVEIQRPLLNAPRHALGTYCEGANGADCHAEGPVTCYLDITRVTGDLDAAASLAKACNQKSIARLESRGVTIIDNVNGKPFGNGEPLLGANLSGCVRARQSR